MIICKLCGTMGWVSCSIRFGDLSEGCLKVVWRCLKDGRSYLATWRMCKTEQVLFLNDVQNNISIIFLLLLFVKFGFQGGHLTVWRFSPILCAKQQSRLSYYRQRQYTILFCTILYYILLYYTILYYIILYYVMLYYIIYKYIILYYISLHYIILY